MKRLRKPALLVILGAILFLIGLYPLESPPVLTVALVLIAVGGVWIHQLTKYRRPRPPR